MAEETQNLATMAFEFVPAAEKPVTEPEMHPEEVVDKKKIAELVSFKEETNVASELPEQQRKALDELRKLVQEAVDTNNLTAPIDNSCAKPKELKAENLVEEEKTAPTQEAASAGAVPVVTALETAVSEAAVVTFSVEEDGTKTVEAIKKTIVSIPSPQSEETKTTALVAENVTIWGVPLLGDERSDVVLLKFLRARDFDTNQAFAMLHDTVRWRHEFGVEALLEGLDADSRLEKVVYVSGVDLQGHPVCYNVYGEFQDKELYRSTFGESPEKFLRWRVRFLEKSIREDLDFEPNGVCRFVQVNDLKASPGPFKRELKVATDRALQVLQDNYPEFVAKQIFINVPWWYLAFYKMISPFFTQRTKSKFVFASPSKSSETLFKFIAPEQIPVQYGGLKKDGEQEFTTAHTATEEIIKPSTKSSIEFPLSEVCTLVWEARVIGWDVSYEAEFVPDAEGGYTVIIQKPRKIALADETVLCGSYKAVEAGKVVLTFDNSASSKKKKLLYRSKIKPSE